ncbi:MAG: hypothetical protein ABI083_15160 [Lapillicoccus sp.]
MTDLTPPPPRDLPLHRRTALRRALEEQIRATEPDPGTRRRLSALPFLAAAAAAALVIGVVWSVRRAEPVAVPGAATSTPAKLAPTAPSAPSAASRAAPTAPGPFTLRGTPLSAAQIAQAYAPAAAVTDPAAAYASCITLVHDQADLQALALPGALTGRVAATNGIVTTVVVADNRHAWTCNVAPDAAVSHPASTTPPSPVLRTTFAFGVNSAKNYGEGPPRNCPTGSGPETGNVSVRGSTTTATLANPNDPCGPTAAQPSGPWHGELLWAGGRLPSGVTSLTFDLPDGRSAAAVVRDGYWVVQDLSEKDWLGLKVDGQTVTVRLSDGRTVPVPLGADTMCNQTSHGC